MLKKLTSIFIVFSIIINAQITFAFDFAPEEGDIAPDFTLNGVNNSKRYKQEWSLSDFKDKYLILYFYPKDFTSGCTLEAKGFTELKKKFSEQNVEIVGISADNEESHDEFCNEKSINYTLLSDPNGFVSKKYGSWIPPFSDRNTFLVSPEGIIMKRWISVIPLNHAKEVYNFIKKSI
tara:strand:- start:65 stop:598 length:534 start_codon:yes stop_codon:yes gene_type:complete